MKRFCNDYNWIKHLGFENGRLSALYDFNCTRVITLTKFMNEISG